MHLNKIIEDSKIHPNKFHNFMVYEAIKRILSGREFDSKMTSLIEQHRLTEIKNPFFIRANQMPPLSVDVGLQIAFHWRDITKRYMQTLLISLGKLADNVSQLDLPFDYVICALQTGITVISDDFTHTFAALNKKEQPGPDGTHYVWWETNILSPLIRASHQKSLSPDITVAPKIQLLLESMNKLAKNPLGFAIQLRVVESIALDMVLLLLTLFSKIEVQGKKIFKSSDMLSWITAHIEDEGFEEQHTPYENQEAMNIVRAADQKDLFRLAEMYVNRWREAIDELYGFLYGNSIDYNGKSKMYAAIENRC